MSTPIKIVVIGDFGASADTQGTIEFSKKSPSALFEKLQPQVELSANRKIGFSSMEDFAPEKLRAALAIGQGADTSKKLTDALHDEGFQKIESAWRGLNLLIEKMPDQGVVLEVLHSSYDDLRQRLLDAVIKPEHAGQTQVPATAILVNFEFLPSGDSFEVFTDLAKMGEAIKVPVVCQTTAGFFGIKHLLHLAALKNPVQLLEKPQYAAYRAFRKTETAFWGSLMLNRFLQRAPYEEDDYKEPHAAKDPASYLWGSGIWLLGANLIESQSEKGHVLGLSGLGTGGEQLGLPYRELPLSRTETTNTPLEATLPLEISEALPYLGLSPVAQLSEEFGGQNQPGMIYVHMAANLHHMPDPNEQQIGLLTVHTSLAYSMTLGRATNLALLHQKELGGLAADEAAKKLEGLLRDELWHKEDDEIKVTVKDGSILAIEYEPHLVIHTRRFVVGFEIGV